MTVVTLMHILRPILRTGTYSDLMKMFPLSFELLMDTSAMIIRHYFFVTFTTVIVLLFQGCHISGGVLEFELCTHHVMSIYILF